ncbi:MAG: hypothetical protein WC505_07775 [Patescibacteria group bacterium]
MKTPDSRLVVGLLVDIVLTAVLAISTWQDFLPALQTGGNFAYFFFLFLAILLISVFSERSSQRLQRTADKLVIYVWMYRIAFLIFLLFTSASFYFFALWLAYVVQVTVLAAGIKLVIIKRKTHG